MHLSFTEMRAVARRHLPRGLFDYIDRGVGEEAGIRALRARLDAAQIVPRVLGAQTNRQSGVRLFGRTLGQPFVLAPTAMAGLIRPDGEIALARTATRYGVPVCLSTQSVTSIETLRNRVPDVALWLQLYLWQDRDLSAGLLGRALAAGAEVLVMTVDTPYGAHKEWNLRSGFGIPFRPGPRALADLCLRPRWVVGMLRQAVSDRRLPRLGNYPDGLQPQLLGGVKDPRVLLRNPMRWDDVAWVRDHWQGPFVLKGILSPDDALKAVKIGAEGIVVSSHGGRNFDAAPAPIDVLPEIAAEVRGHLDIMADSGVRRGIDILRYLDRGASAVMLGKLPLWALAAGGERGVDAALGGLAQEYVEALDYAGR